MTPYPPNPPEGAVIRVEDAELEEGVTCVVMSCCGFAFAADHEDDSGPTFTCPVCVPSADALAAADSWWRSRLESDETVEPLAFYLATVRGVKDWQTQIGPARAVITSLLPVNEPGCRAPHCWNEYGTPCATCPVNEPETDT